MTTTYDAIILGAGHNGLILQAYLGKAGLKTLAIDRSPVAGGGSEHAGRPAPSRASCTTPTPSSSAPSPRCRGTPISSSNGTAPATSSPSSTSRCSPATAARWNGGPTSHETIASFAAFSRRDADTLRRWHDEFVPIVRDILAPEGRSPPLPPRRAPRAARTQQRRPAAAGGERALAAAIRRTGVRASDHQGRPPLLQWTARGRPAAAAASAITSPRCWRARPRRRCRAAARRRSRARSKRRCAQRAATSG